MKLLQVLNYVSCFLFFISDFLIWITNLESSFFFSLSSSFSHEPEVPDGEDGASDAAAHVPRVPRPR